MTERFGFRMNKEHYVAYVSTYTFGDDYGLRIYDVDMEKGTLIERSQLEITNSSYITISHNRKFLYAITDFGVQAYAIEKNGDLRVINKASINGMRGCYLNTDYTDSFLFVAGYHDGKVTVMKLREDGGIDHITDEAYHKGLGSISERNFRPHIQCVKMTRDNKYLCAVDLGTDHINIYKFDAVNGKIKRDDVIYSEVESGPRHIKFLKNGEIGYVIHELKNEVGVYRYKDVKGHAEFELLQMISTLNKPSKNAAASGMNLSEDDKYLVCTNAGDDSACIFEVQEDGTLKHLFTLPVSGEYPKDALIFPDNRHLVSLNHEADTMTFFSIDYEKKVMVMSSPTIHIVKPNCLIFHKTEE